MRLKTIDRKRENRMTKKYIYHGAPCDHVDYDAWVREVMAGINPVTGEPAIPEVRFITSINFLEVKHGTERP